MESDSQLTHSRRVARLGRTESLRAPLDRYLFGPKPTLVVEPDDLLVEIDRLGGVVVPADIMRVTGLRRAPAEALLCRLVARHRGDVFVHGTAVLYRFPRLMRGLPRLISAAAAPRPIWEQLRVPDAITGNRQSVDWFLALANLLVLIGAAVGAASTFSLSVWQPACATVFLAAALFALVMPLMRVVRRRVHLNEVAAENGRRALVRVILQRRSGTTIAAHTLSHAWVASSGRAVGHRRLFDEVLALGGEPDIDGQARIHFRFPDLDHETGALTSLRSLAQQQFA